jgi:polyphosphate glucokinase
MNVLVIDIGGTHVKLRTQRHAGVVKIDSGPKMTPQKMLTAIQGQTKGWNFDHVSIGYPGPVVHDIPLREPHNLGKGWKGFRFDRAFKKPVHVINDAAMQALGSYRGGRMLFLGLGTGLGSAMVVDGIVQAMELAHLPWKKGKTYEEFVGAAALEHDGRKTWTKHVHEVIHDLQAALECDYIVIGGGNAVKVRKLPKGVVLGSNDNAFKGGFLLWEKAENLAAKGQPTNAKPPRHRKA